MSRILDIEPMARAANEDATKEEVLERLVGAEIVLEGARLDRDRPRRPCRRPRAGRYRALYLRAIGREDEI